MLLPFHGIRKQTQGEEKAEKAGESTCLTRVWVTDS